MLREQRPLSGNPKGNVLTGGNLIRHDCYWTELSMHEGGLSGQAGARGAANSNNTQRRGFGSLNLRNTIMCEEPGASTIAAGAGMVLQSQFGWLNMQVLSGISDRSPTMGQRVSCGLYTSSLNPREGWST